MMERRTSLFYLLPASGCTALNPALRAGPGPTPKEERVAAAELLWLLDWWLQSADRGRDSREQ